MGYMGKIFKRIGTLLICLAVLLPAFVSRADDHKIIENLPVYVDGVLKGGVVKTLHYSYAYNRYVSLRDMAYAMNGSNKQFNVTYSSETLCF